MRASALSPTTPEVLNDNVVGPSGPEDLPPGYIVFPETRHPDILDTPEPPEPEQLVRLDLLNRYHPPRARRFWSKEDNPR